MNQILRPPPSQDPLLDGIFMSWVMQKYNLRLRQLHRQSKLKFKPSIFYSKVEPLTGGSIMQNNLYGNATMGQPSASFNFGA